MKKFLLKAFMLLCLILWGGVSSAWADTYTLDFEGTGTFPYNSDWTVECTENTAENHTTDGSNCGSFNFSSTKYITYKNALTNVTSISFWTNRTSTNTTNPTFTLEGSTNNGVSWTTLGNSVTPNIARNTWGQSTITLTTPFTGKVRLKYSCTSTAVKLIDDIVITTTSSKTLLSIAVSGTPTKTSYFAGDVLDPAGLVVTGTYDSGDPEVITSGIDWTFDPETLSAGNTTCDVMASVGSVLSDVYTVTGLTVTAVPTYTAHFSVNGVDDHSADFVGREGAAITFPADPSATSGKVFTGWVTTPIDGTTNVAPSFVNKANQVLGTADVTYYAVFATAAAGEDTWNQVTTLANIVEGQYVIKNGDFVLSNALASSTAPEALDAPTVTTGVITGTVEDNMIFNLTSTGTANQFYVKNPDGKYLYETSSNNGLRINTTSDKWTFEVNTTGYFAMKGANSSRYCAKYDAGSDWRSYTTATAGNYANSGKLELYKLTSNVTYSNYCTSFAVVTLIGIEATGTPDEFWKGDDFNHNGMTVTAIWSDDNNTDVTALAEFSTPDMATAGEKTVTVTYQGETDSYNITVQTIANTQATAYTTTQAKALIDAGKDLGTEVYVTGVVSKVDSYNSTYKSITYWLEENSFEIYGGLAAVGDEFSSKEDIEVGATVVVLGIIKKYNSTYEMDKDNHLVSYVAPDLGSTDITISAAGYTTYYNSTAAYTMPADCEGYVFTAADGLELAYEAEEVVPAGEPLVIHSDVAGTKTLVFTTSTEETCKDNEKNDLDGTDTETALEADANSYFYGLSLNADSDVNSVGFYWMAAEGAAFTNGAHKAYLKLPKSMFAEARSGFAFNEDTEAISTIEAEATATTTYNLAGQRVNDAKGLVIKNGKKIFVK